MKNALAWILSLMVAGLFLAPLLWMLRASFSPESQIFQSGFAGGLFSGSWTIQNYADAWRRAAFGRAVLNSLLQVGVIVGIGLVVNTMAAYAFARLEFFGRDLLFSVLVVLIILPVETLVVPMLFAARDLGLTGSYGQAMAGLIAPFAAKAFNIYFLRQHFLAVPVELEEAAVLDGASTARQFWSVALPAIKPALATVAVLDLVTHWGDFLWPLTIVTREETRTVQLSLANLFTQPPIQWGAILACSVLTTLPIVALFHWLQRYIVATGTRSGIK